MSILEGTVFLLLLLLALPGFCKRIRRPGLLYPLYIIAGAGCGAFMNADTITTWREIGQFGFILLLFSVGLEVELPERRESLIAVKRGIAWMALLALPVVTALVWLDFGYMQSAVAAAALSSTSVGMAYALWKHNDFASAENARDYLQWMVAIEVISIIFLALAGPVISGVAWWITLLHVVGLLTAAAGAAYVALRWVPLLGTAVHRGLALDVPVLVLVLFALCALGGRLGLSAPKTAFVLGLFISRSTDEEANLSHKLEPLRDRMFVPVFFFGLGTLVDFKELASLAGFGALCAGGLLFAYRRLLYGTFFSRFFGGRVEEHAISAPVLTISAVAVDVLVHSGAPSNLLTWTLAASITLTLCAAFNPVQDNRRLVEMDPVLAAPEAVNNLEDQYEELDYEQQHEDEDKR